MLHLLLTSALLLGLARSGPTGGQIPPLVQKPTERTTGTTCGLYARPTTQSPMLSIVGPGMAVMVTNSSNNAHFVRAQLTTKEGKTLSGYLFRACLTTP